jgi:hypothetical protein
MLGVFMMNAVMLSVIMLSVIMLSVMAPFCLSKGASAVYFALLVFKMISLQK